MQPAPEPVAVVADAPASAYAPWSPHAWPRGVVAGAVVVAVALALLLLVRVRSILVLALVAATIAYIVEPAVRAAERRLGAPRLLCAIVAGAVVAALELLTLGWLLPRVAREGVELARQLPELVARLAERVDLQALVERASAASGGAGWLGERFVDVAGAAVGRTATLVALTLLLPVLVGLLVAHFPGARRAVAYVPRARRPEVRRVLLAMDDAVGGFFRGRVIISAIVGALLAVGWSICGVPNALALGFLAGVLNLIPYASGLAAVLAVLLGVAAGAGGGELSWITVALWPALVFAAVNLLENSVLTPWIQSRAVNLSALTVMLATLTGGALAGALGLFYAIPVAACLKTLLQEWGLPRLRAWAEQR